MCPENTLIAFARAAALGAHMIELDVQLTRDGEVVVMHDWTLERTTDGAGAVSDRTLAEIRRLDAGAWFGPAFRGTRVPTLAEVVAAVGLRVNVELKPVGDDGLETRALAVVESASALARVVFSSFDADALERLRARAAGATLAVLWDAGPVADAVARARCVGARALHLRKDRTTPDALAAAAAAGLPERATEEEGDGRAQARPPSRVPHHRLARSTSAGRRPGAAHEPARRAAPRPLPALHLPRLLPRPLPRDLRPRGGDRRRARGGRRGAGGGEGPPPRAPGAAGGGAAARLGAGLRRHLGGRRAPRPDRRSARERASAGRPQPLRGHALRLRQGGGAHGLHAPPDRARGPRLGGEPDDRRVRARAPARAHGGDHRRDGAGARDPAGGAAGMTGRIRDEAIRAVRERASLSEVISDVVALRRRGRSAVGLCPFHAEKTPSFTVSEERGFFHCFGCGEHGDVFAFLMKAQALTFPEAVRRVAERFGVPLPEEAGEPARRREPLAAANAVAAAFFQAELRGPGGGRARAYLRERGLSEEVIERFGLGWAPGAGEALARHLRTKGLPLEDALTAGLVMRRDRPDGAGGVLDRFRDRLMFPITDASGKTIAFGGRILPGRPASGDPPPKYLNSAESPVFRKGHTLYGLALARDAIRKT